MRGLKPWPIAYAVALAAAIGLLLSLLPPLSRLEAGLADQRVARLTPPAALHPQLIVIAFDEASLARLPRRSPLDREALAAVVAAVAAGGAAAIAVDVLLDQPAAGDARLGGTLSALRVPLVLAASGPAPAAQEQSLLRHGQAAVPWLTPDPVDGIVRRIGAPADATLAGRLVVATGRMPMPAAQTAMPLTAAGQPPFAVVPAHAVLAGQVAPALFRQRLVLIGVTGDGIDRHATPLAILGKDHAAGTPGVLLHAWQVRSLLGADDAPRRHWALDGAAVVLAALAGVLAGRARLALAGRLALGIMLPLLLVLGGFAAYANGLWLVNIVAAMLAALAGTGIGLAQAHDSSRRTNAAIRATFGQYLAPDVVEQLLRQPELVTAGAAPRAIAVLFTDLAGFTPLVAQLPPDQVEPLLSAYLDRLTRIIAAHGGVVDKIVGDAIHALFGAPVAQADAAARALAAALAIDAAAQAFRRERADIAVGPTRIAVHHGQAIVGNFGGALRLDYTAHGDTMNIGARLEQAGKALGTRLLVSEAALAAAGADRAEWLPVGALALAGIADPVPVFTPGRGGAAMAQALAQMAQQPMAALARLKALGGDHPVVQLHIARLEQGLASPVIDLR